jgi:hypothetical protein
VKKAEPEVHPQRRRSAQADAREKDLARLELGFSEDIDLDREQRYFAPAEMIQIVNAADG